MYNLELKDANEYFDKSIVKYICKHKEWTIQNIKWDKYVQMFGYSSKVDLLYSEVLERFLFRYKDYEEGYESDHIDSLNKYVKFLIRLALKTYLIEEAEYNSHSVPLEQISNDGVKDYLNCKEFGVDLYGSPSGISVNEDILRETIRDLYILGLQQEEDYMLVVYMLYHTDMLSLLDYYAIQGKNVTSGMLRTMLNSRPEIIEILTGLDQVNDNTLLNIIRDRVQNIEVVDRFIGFTISED